MMGRYSERDVSHVRHNLVPLPDGWDAWGYDMKTPSEELSSYDIRECPEDIEELWYWYKTGSYEGSGAGVARFSNGEYGFMDFCHCSCYGPCDGKWQRYSTLTALVEHITPYDRRDLSTPIAAAVAAAGIQNE